MSDAFDPAWMMLFILRIVLVVSTVFFISIMMLSVVITLEDDQLDRFAHEIGEVVLNSELAENKGILSEEKLDLFIGSALNSFQNYDFSGSDTLKEEIILGSGNQPNIEPEFARHCRFAYNIQIEGGDMEWNFGYHSVRYAEFSTKPDDFKMASENFPISVRKKDGSIVPADMTITTFLTSVTRYSCIAERAKKYKEKQELGLPVCDGVCEVSIGNFGNSDDHVCTFSVSDTNLYLACRYLPDVKIVPSYFTYSGKMNLVAYPLKQSAASDNFSNYPETANTISRENCQSVKNLGNIVQKTDTEDVDSVIFCLEARR